MALDKAHLNVALRVREIELKGLLEGHKIKARPATGYEKNILVDWTRAGRFVDALIFMFARMISSWDLVGDDNKPLEISEDSLRMMSTPALDSIQDALEPLLAELDEEAVRFLEDASETLAKDTPSVR